MHLTSPITANKSGFKKNAEEIRWKIVFKEGSSTYITAEPEV